MFAVAARAAAFFRFLGLLLEITRRVAARSFDDASMHLMADGIFIPFELTRFRTGTSLLYQ